MNFLIPLALRAVEDLYQVSIAEKDLNFQETRKEFDGQVTLVTFPFTRLSKKSPEQTGTEIGEYLLQHSENIAAFNVVKGFLNLSLADSYWLDVFHSTIARPGYGDFAPRGERVMVEYSSPNTNKPLHLGHIRNNLLGFSVSVILRAYGYDVVRVNLVNDRGIHICKSMLAWQKWGQGETPESSGMKGDHLAGKYYVIFDKEYKKEIIALVNEGLTEEQAKKQAPLILEAQKMLQAWEAGDEAVTTLWRTMNNWVYAGFEETYAKLGVAFEKFYYESNTYLLGKDIIGEGLEMGVFFKKPDGSVWIDLTAEGLDEKLVLRADGTSVYITQDLGTAQLKYDDFKMDQSIYVVGNEQDYHFKVLFLILEKLQKSWAKGLYHLSYGMVDLPSGKMKSREGTVVDADDLIDEMVQTAKQRTEELGKVDGFSETEKAELYRMIGMGALKYFLLKVEPKKRLLFDPNESIDFQGHTGPFIQYTFARIRSVIKKSGYIPAENTAAIVALQPGELELIQVLSNYMSVIESAARDHSPAQVANFVYELAKGYNKFYHEVPILKAEDERERVFRLELSAATGRVIEHAMGLLGIEVPEQM